MRIELGRREQGFIVGDIPYGFHSVPTSEVYMDKKGREKPRGYLPGITPGEAEIVLRIYQEFADGISLNQIFKRLNEEKIPGRKGKIKTWGGFAIHKILKNEKYIGKWVWNRYGTKREPLTEKVRRYEKPKASWDVRIFEHTRIVPQDLWDKVQTRRKEAKGIWPGGPGRRGFQGQKGSAVKLYPKSLLSGAMVCSVCGGSVSMVGGKSGGYYGCSKASKHDCTNRQHVKGDIADRIVVRELQTKLENTEALSYIFRRVEKMVAKEFSKAPEIIKLKEAEYEQYQRMVKNFVDFIAEGRGRTSPTVAERLEACETKVENLRADIDILRQSHKRVFIAPPKEWIEEKVSDLKGILEEKTGRSALLLRKLLGDITLEPCKTEEGRGYYKAYSNLQTLALLETPPKSKAASNVEAPKRRGSPSFVLGAPSQFSKGIWLRAEVPFFIKTARLTQNWLAGVPLPTASFSGYRGRLLASSD